VARGIAQAPQCERREQRCCERVAPEADQRVHAPPPGLDAVKSADISEGVAKFYK
jgi:hypothetical protein